LITEQEVYTESLRTWASEEEFARQKVALRGPFAQQIAAMRRAVVETTETRPQVDPQSGGSQNANMQALVRMEHETGRSRAGGGVRKGGRRAAGGAHAPSVWWLRRGGFVAVRSQRLPPAA
jgi:hypothetical protein